tara:strand:- start:4278 stop:4403 length:126 start_codon:yes stop_codon:yes gene_type:complete
MICEHKNTEYTPEEWENGVTCSYTICLDCGEELEISEDDEC